MAWVKVPPENHPLFRAALPKHPRVLTMNMFGGVAGLVHGNIFAGLFGRSVIVKLSPADQEAALALDGATLFDPMGNGRVMRDTVHLPETVMDEQQELRAWLRKALDHTATLPPKQAKAKSTAKGTAKSAAKKAKPAKATAKGTAKSAAKKAKPAKATAKPAKTLKPDSRKPKRTKTSKTAAKKSKRAPRR